MHSWVGTHETHHRLFQAVLHLVGVGLLDHWLHRPRHANSGVVSEHLVVALLSIYQLQLVELHVIFLLLDEGIFLFNLFVEIAQHLQVLGARGTTVVQLLQLKELLIESAVLLLHQVAGLTELVLHFFDVSGLLVDHALHLLAEVVLQDLFFLLELELDLLGSTEVLLQAFFALSLRGGYSVVHALDLSLFDFDLAFE